MEKLQRGEQCEEEERKMGRAVHRPILGTKEEEKTGAKHLMKAGEKENGLAKMEVKCRIDMDEWWETGAAKTMEGKDEKWAEGER